MISPGRCPSCRAFHPGPNVCQFCGARYGAPAPPPQHAPHPPAPSPAPKSGALRAVVVFVLFLVIGAGGAIGYFERDRLFSHAQKLASSAMTPGTTKPVGPTPVGPPQASSRAAIGAQNGGSVVLPDGARVDVGPRALDGNTELVLTRAKLPPVPGSELLLSDGYHVSMTKRARPSGASPISIALPIPMFAGSQPLTVVAWTGRTFVPLPSRIDAARRLVIVDDPMIRALDVPMDYEPFRQAAPGTIYVPVSNPNGGPTEVYAIAKNPLAVPPSCRRGDPGETHEKRGHVFRIIIETRATCALVEEISDRLQEAFNAYAKEYGTKDGKNPLGMFTPEHRMRVYVRELAPDDNAEYEFKDHSGYIAVDPRKTERAGDPPAEVARRHRILSNSLHHELFHAVQDAYRVMFVAASNGARWWYEATAERAAQKMRRLDITGAMDEAHSEYGKHVASVPATSSAMKAHNGGTMCYGNAMLVAHVERVSPTYLRDTLNGDAYTSVTYLKSLVVAGKLEDTYDDFSRDLLARSLSTGPWFFGRIVATEGETRVIRTAAEDYGATEAPPTRLTAKAEREAPQSYFRVAGPMTTHYFGVQATSAFTTPRVIEVNWSAKGRVAVSALRVKDGRPIQIPSTVGQKETFTGFGSSFGYIAFAIASLEPEREIRFDFDVAVKPEEGGFLETDVTEIDPRYECRPGCVRNGPPGPPRSSIEGAKTWQGVKKLLGIGFAINFPNDRASAVRRVRIAETLGKQNVANHKPPPVKPDDLCVMTFDDQSTYAEDEVVEAWSKGGKCKDRNGQLTVDAPDETNLLATFLYRDWVLTMSMTREKPDGGPIRAPWEAQKAKMKALIDKRFPPSPPPR